MGNVVKLESTLSAGAPCIRLQSGPRRHQAGEDSPLTPELKAFIDAAIVPVLIKEYLAVSGIENELAKNDSDAAHFDSRTAARELRAVKP